jgi:signal transduction histidine kinase
MKRPWQVWLVFAVCVLGAAGAMAWLTREAVESDRLRRAAKAEAELEQRVSLALWRMDTELAPIIAEEVIRPPATFRPTANGAVDPPPNVLLQFETRPNGFWCSPQCPPTQKGTLPKLAELSQAVTCEQLLPELPSTPLPTAEDLARNKFRTNAEMSSAPNAPAVGANSAPVVGMNAPPANAANSTQQQVEVPYQFFEGNRSNDFYDSRVQVPQQQQTANQAPPNQQAQAAANQQYKEADFQQRSKRYQSATEQSLLNYNQRGGSNDDVKSPPDMPVKGGGSKVQLVDTPELVGVSRPVWVGGRLLLARRVESRGTTAVQGSWLDWPQLKARLLAEATDLLPKADLAPVTNDAADDPSRMLAGLPVRLVVNESVAEVGVGPTLRWALWMGWGAVLVTVLAAAALLQGVMALSERRAAFVSSVTHELRTPLTTFRMYAEMLARGMVPDAARRQEYFETLQKESERLTLLVENVLAYARLERGRKPQAQDRVTVVDLLKRVSNRLQQRASQAGMECVVELNPKTASQEFTTDLAVVEQILFNLVDNAAKYARSANDHRIHVEANHKSQYVTFIVRDHGPGIGNGAAERSQPFEKSAQESAESAPGVGLGLALCRRLARQLGGRLEVAGGPGEGAEVTLLLPVS